jgi:hypothetical protein
MGVNAPWELIPHRGCCANATTSKKIQTHLFKKLQTRFFRKNYKLISSGKITNLLLQKKLQTRFFRKNYKLISSKNYKLVPSGKIKNSLHIFFAEFPNTFTL